MMIDRRIKSLDANFVSVDSETSVRQLASALLQQGFRSVFLFCGAESFTCEDGCVAAFRGAHAQSGEALSAEQIIRSPHEQGSCIFPARSVSCAHSAPTPLSPRPPFWRPA